MTMANVIDISEYQDPAKFDYQAAKSNGIKAVIIRLSVGNRRDNHAAEHIANCKKYGLKWHGYHYWYNLSGEAAFAVSDAQSLGLTSSQYFFLDMEDKTLSSDWSAQFESFRSAVGGKYKVGLYCSDSPYKSHFDNAKMVAEGVYRWIAAYSYEPANYDTWQMSGEGSGGFGSYTGDVDRDYDKTGNLFKEETQPITPSTTPLYRQIIGEAGYDTDSGIYGLGRSYDNGKTFHVMDTVYGRIYRQQDGDSIWPFLVDKVKAVLDWSAITNKPDVALKSDLTWSNITNKPDLALKTDLTWSNVTGKPDVALKSDVAAVSAVASSASDKADSNAKLIAGKAGQADLDNVSKTASSALDKATSNANALAGKVNKADLTWTNITNRPDFDKVASQASQAVVTANTAESQASAAGQAAASASTQSSAAKASADTAVATANAAKASASTASATAASAQQVANSASASASATAVALKNKADTDTVNAQFTAVNSNVASAQSTADSAVSVADGAVTTANSAKSTATSAAGVANTANATANSALAKANSASTVASQANSTATQASQSASSAISVANQAKSTADSASTTAANAQSSANSAQNTANTAIKASETLKDLGNYTATASGTASNSTYSGLPRTSGVSMSRVYNNGYPTPYGNVLNVAGIGAGQLLLGWSGTSSANEHLYYRSHRDNGSGGWSTWDKIAYVSDLTWSNISGKPDVATKADVSSAQSTANTAKSTADSALSKANSNATTLNNKVNKSDLTWANISGKPSIPNADDTTTVSSGNLNNYTTTGKYYMPNGLSQYTNHPTTGTDMGDWFVMKVDAYHGGDMIVQTIYQINSGDVWIRQRWSGAWKSWRQINFWG